MTHFMDQGRCDAAADHPLTRDADHGDRILAAAWQTGPCAPYCAADAAIQIADHRRGFVVLRQRQGVRRDDIETGQPDALFAFAALANDLMEEFELRENGVEPQPEENEPALNVLRRGLPAFAVQPAQKVLNPLLQLAPPLGEKTLDRDLGGGQKTRGQDHRLGEHKWLHSSEPRQ